MSDKEHELFEKCCQGDLFEVKKLLEQGTNPNIVQSFSAKDRNHSKDCSALCVASIEGHVEVANLLLKHGADVNYRCLQGESALFLAVRRGHLKITQSLLEAGANVVYTARAGEKVLLENWEVFTQALVNAYPKDIDDPCNSRYKAVVQLLLEHNANSQRPSTLYEALYCSLTVFANPIAVYCVGGYAALSCDHPSLFFCEDNFLGAVCHAFDMPHVAAFVSTIQSILSAYKLRQKDVAQSLVKNFNWGDLLRRLSECSLRGTLSGGFSVNQVLKQFMEVVHVIVSNFQVRSDIQSQFSTLTTEDMGRIGRLFKSLFDQMEEDDASSKYIAFTWSVYCFLLKHQLKTSQYNNVARLLLRSGWNKGQDCISTLAEFERRVLLKCTEEDISLAHMLIDFGVSVNGECLVRFVDNGHVDIVDRCVGDNELLFCKEVCHLLQTPLTIRNSANRNIRRCIRVIKSRRKSVEEERSKNEEELLNDAPTKSEKKKRRRSRAKKQQSDWQSSEVESLTKNESTSAEISDSLSSNVNNPSCGDAEPAVKEDIESNEVVPFEPDHFMRHGTGEPIVKGGMQNTQQTKGKSKKRKNKKKQLPKVKSNPLTIPEVCSPDEINSFSDSFEVSNDWKQLMQTSSRRRRISSSSSEASVGSRKSVHFSHPLTLYENTKLTEKSRHRKISSEAVPKASNLKQTVEPEKRFDLSETYRTNSQLPEYVNNLSRLNSFEPLEDCFDDDFEGSIPWRPVSNRWSPRFEDLSETLISRLKQLHWTNREGEDDTVYFCDRQKHLNIASGPDLSQIFLGLTKKGQEISIKKISGKKVPLLLQKSVTDALSTLDEHPGISSYLGIIREKNHFYVLQEVADYSLVEIIRKKMILLPSSTPECCRQMVTGLEYLHNCGILHMSLKPSNVFLCSDGRLRLADYGIYQRYYIHGKKNSSGPTTTCMCWMATECMQYDQKAIFSKQSDVMCLGMVMFYLLTNGGHPYGDPDAAPGECMKNINKGVYNLKALTDPLAHHLVKSLLYREAGKRLSISEVVCHPFLWTDEDKDSYLLLLTDSALAGNKTPSGRNILDELHEHEEVLIHDNYAREENFIDSKDRVATVKQVLLFLQACLNDEVLFKSRTKPEIRALAPSPAHYFRLSFPGLLLQGSKVLPMASIKGEFRDNAPPVNVEATADSAVHGQPVMSGDALDEYCIKNKGDKSFNDKKNDPSNSTDFPDEPDIKSYKEIAPPGGNIIGAAKSLENLPLKDKKNTGLCLSNLHVNGNNNVELLKADLVDSRSASSSDESSTFLLDNDWSVVSPMTDTCSSSSNSSEPERAPENCLKLDKTSSFATVSSQVSSPDDWIEIGSPLVEENYEYAAMGKSLPISLTKRQASSSLDDDFSTGSSSCSVDGCFDFGNVPGADGNNHLASPDISNPIADGFAPLHGEKCTRCTDIDELD